MATWEDLRIALLVLRDREPTPLRRTPSLGDESIPEPPYQIGLAAWAAEAASELFARFGEDLDLTVGFLSFPDPTRFRFQKKLPSLEHVELAPSEEFAFWLPDDVEIGSGHDLRTELHVLNRSEAELVITNGNLTARVIDPHSGEAVGGFAGAQSMPLVRFRVPIGESRPIPLLIGTASGKPSLGYAIPLGEWAIDVTLALEDGRVLRTPALAVTIV